MDPFIDQNTMDQRKSDLLRLKFGIVKRSNERHSYIPEAPRRAEEAFPSVKMNQPKIYQPKIDGLVKLGNERYGYIPQAPRIAQECFPNAKMHQRNIYQPQIDQPVQMLNERHHASFSDRLKAKSLKKITLESLPSKLRDRIFRLVAVAHEPFEVFIQSSMTKDIETRNRSIFPSQPPMSMINRRFRQEVLPIFYGDNTFHFSTYTSRDYLAEWASHIYQHVAAITKVRVVYECEEMCWDGKTVSRLIRSPILAEMRTNGTGIIDLTMDAGELSKVCVCQIYACVEIAREFESMRYGAEGLEEVGGRVLLSFVKAFELFFGGKDMPVYSRASQDCGKCGGKVVKVTKG